MIFSARYKRTLHIKALSRAIFSSSIFLITSGLVTEASAQFAVPGKADVSQTGAATYTIPIAVPPGIAGLQPKLSFGYSSQAGDGLMGVGWGLYGLSAITRCPRTKIQDGVFGPVSYDANDRFCLDGRRLNVVGGTYGAADSHYRAEIQDFSSIVAYGTAGAGPSYFKVWTKDGLILEFGNTEDSKVNAVSQISVRTWALNKISDKSGNSIHISYSRNAEEGDYYPQKVEYAGSGSDNSAYVYFGYEYKTITHYRYVGGYKIRNRSRIKTITVKDGGDLVREYRIGYEDGAATGRSRITSIKQCSSSAEADCLPPLTFGWTDKPKSFGPSSLWANAYTESGGWTDEAKNPRYVIDVSGDGRADILGYANDGVYVAPSTGTGLASRSAWSPSYGTSTWDNGNVRIPRMLADVNGDRKADLIGFAYSNSSLTVALAKADGTGFEVAQTWSSDFLREKTIAPYSWDPAARTALAYSVDGGCEHECSSTAYYPDSEVLTPRYMADVNGDGRADVVGFGADSVWVSLSTGSGFGTKLNWSNSFGFKDYGNAPANYNALTPRRIMADVNGDGMDDVVEFGVAGVYVGLSTAGGGFDTRTKWSQGSDFANWYVDPKRPIHVADVNGDGLGDLVGFGTDGVYVALSTGKGFVAATIWQTYFSINGGGWGDEKKLPRLVADVNGDGMADIVGFSSIGPRVALSTGSSFFTYASWSSEFGSNAANGTWSDETKWPRRLADVNGDGLLDVIGFKGGVQVALGTGTAPDMMISVTSPVGISYGFTYLQLAAADSATYVKDNSVYPRIDVQGPYWVVTKLSWTDGLGGTAARAYRYAGAKTSLDGRGFLGFREVTARDLQTSMEINTAYNQTFPYIGLPIRTEKGYVFGSQLKVLQRKINTYVSSSAASAANRNAAGKTNLVSMTSSDLFTWDIVNDDATLPLVALPTVKSTFTYDEWGNVLLSTVETFDGDSGLPDGYSKQTATTYLNSTGQWLIGLPLTSAITSKTPTN